MNRNSIPAVRERKKIWGERLYFCCLREKSSSGTRDRLEKTRTFQSVVTLKCLFGAFFVEQKDILKCKKCV